jgi:RNA polymerase sigma factor (sigma-70 family)
LNEQELIAALKKNEAPAFGQLVDLYQHRVYNTVLSIIQQEEDAEDIVQEVFVAVFHAIGTFREDARLSTWLYRIAVTKSLEWIRKKGRKKRYAFIQSLDDDTIDKHGMEIPHFHHPGVQLEKKEQAAILFAAIARLPEQQKTAFLLSHTEQLSQAEVAMIMETTISAVESLLFRAKRRLRELLAQHYDIRER